MNLDPEKLIVLFVIAMLIMGPKRLPEAARTMGRWMAELRKYTSGFQSEFHDLLSEPRERGQPSATSCATRSQNPGPRWRPGLAMRKTRPMPPARSGMVPTPPCWSPPTISIRRPVSFSPETVSAPLNSVPDDPTLN